MTKEACRPTAGRTGAAMPEPFDPYLQWLGIRDPQRPPNHYRLLGVELFEGDPEVLANAADRQMSHVRSFQAGPNWLVSQRLLNELATAKVCLLHAEKKALYDARLRAELAVAEPAPPVVSGWEGPRGPVRPPGCVPVPPPPPVARAAARRAGPRRFVLAAITVVCAAMAAVLVGLIALVVSRGSGDLEDAAALVTAEGPGDRAEPKEPPDDGGGAKPATSPDGEPEPPSKAPSPSLSPLPPAPEPKPKPSVPPGKKQVAVSGSPSPGGAEPLPPASESLEAARWSIKRRDMATARLHLDRAERAAFPADRAAVDQLRGAFVPWESFWNAVRGALRDLKPGDVLDAGGRKWTVVRSDPERPALVVRTGGLQTSYSIGEMPAEVVGALAERKLPAVAASNLARAAFLAMDPQGDPRRAKALCDEGAKQGLPVDALLAELKPLLPGSQPAAAPRGKLAIPDAAAQEKALAEVKELFKTDYARALKPGEKADVAASLKAALAATLLRRGSETADNPAVRYVLLAEARELAVAAGDAAVARRASGEMAKHHDVDPLEETSRAVIAAAGRAMPAQVRRSLAAAAVKLAEEALSRDRYDLAAELTKAGYHLATKGLDLAVARQASDLGQSIAWLQQQAEVFRQAGEVLAKDPENPKANQVQGAYLALVKNNWARGLPLLAKGSDPTLRALAEAEMPALRSPPSPDAMVKLGDAWRESLPSIEDPLQRYARRRALFWYERAQRKLAGFTQAVVARHVEELKAADSPRGKP